MRRGLSAEINDVAQLWTSPKLTSGFFAGLERQIHEIRDCRDELARLQSRVADLQSRLAIPRPLGRRISSRRVGTRAIVAATIVRRHDALRRLHPEMKRLAQHPPDLLRSCLPAGVDFGAAAQAVTQQVVRAFERKDECLIRRVPRAFYAAFVGLGQQLALGSSQDCAARLSSGSLAMS